MEFDINYLAVIGAAAANMVVGGLWYGPVFGAKWKKLMGLTPEKMKSMPLTAGQAMAGGLVIALVMAYVLAHVAIAFGAVGVPGALMLAFWMWLGFYATITAHGWLFEGKPFQLFVLNAACGLVTLVAMSLVLVLWV